MIVSYGVFLIMTMENHLLRHVYVKKEKILDYFSSEILFFFSNEVACERKCFRSDYPLTTVVISDRVLFLTAS